MSQICQCYGRWLQGLSCVLCGAVSGKIKRLPYGGIGCAGRGVLCLARLLPPLPPRLWLPAVGTLSWVSLVSAPAGRILTLSHLVPAAATQALPPPAATSGSWALLLLRLRPLCRGVCPLVSPRCACVCRCARGPCGPSPLHHAGPGVPAPSSQAPAAGEDFRGRRYPYLYHTWLMGLWLRTLCDTLYLVGR